MSEGDGALDTQEDDDADQHRLYPPVEGLDGDPDNHRPSLNQREPGSRKRSRFLATYQMEAAMEADTTTIIRGTPDSAAWFRSKLDELGMGQSALARRMIASGDDRQFDTILRSLRRMASGEARISGEMRTVLTLLSEVGVTASPGAAANNIVEHHAHASDGTLDGLTRKNDQEQREKDAENDGKLDLGIRKEREDHEPEACSNLPGPAALVAAGALPTLSAAMIA